MKNIAAVAVLLVSCAGSVQADVVRITIADTIHPINDEYVERAMAMAAERKADALVIELRTPGGLESSMRGIVEKILESPVPVLVWVGPSGSRAASAGFFILQSADVAAMAPGTNTGSAHPVAMGGEPLDDTMKAKIQNDASAFMRTLAQRRGRNVAVAESAVRESKSFTEDEALQQRLIDVVAGDVPSLLRWADGRTIRRFNGTTTVLRTANKPIVDYRMSLVQQVLSWVMNPNVTFILISVGMIALWAEFNHPGAIVPGVVGAVAILLALFALNLLPTRYAAVVLLVAAFAFFALEAKFTSYGILGAAGVGCMIAGALMLVDGPIPEMRVNLVTALSVSVPLGMIAVFLMTLVFRAHKNPVVTGVEAMVGALGVARTPIAADGKVFVHGELWNATAPSEIAEGARVRVRGVDGLRVVVEPADQL